ncbi:phage head closure protein [Agrobacterium pusense]|uniref:phage head closure protein n=1 Tax=Agrobacterium pusense TaxID=648995 RepID=UPI00156B143D|nr:phage head closure protein [Agrobacterium pusense]QKJ91108.1 phage head closure protein [Agrobacterium pusense]
MINIGRMDRRVAIERQTEIVKPSGDVVKTWTTIAVVWAEIIQQSATEFFTGYGEAETGSVIFRIRYLPGITTADRVTYNGSGYGLKEIKELGRYEALELRGEVLL